MAELWGSVVVSVLFWGFANQITTVEEASQFYPLFGLGANVALIFSGQAVKYFSQVGGGRAGHGSDGGGQWQAGEGGCMHCMHEQPAHHKDINHALCHGTCMADRSRLARTARMCMWVAQSNPQPAACHASCLCTRAVRSARQCSLPLPRSPPQPLLPAPPSPLPPPSRVPMQVRANLPPEVDGWGVSLNGMMGMVVIGGVLISLIYFGLNRVVVPQIKSLREKKKKKKVKMTVGESFKFLAASPYIRDMATLVVAYGISINLVEVTWKSKIKAQFPNPNDYSAFMGEFSTATGTVTFIMMILSRWIFKKFGWGVAAQITPTVLLLTGLIFFALVLFSDSVKPALAAMGMTPLYAAVLVGAAQNVFSKSSKYSLFGESHTPGTAQHSAHHVLAAARGGLPAAQPVVGACTLCLCLLSHDQSHHPPPLLAVPPPPPNQQTPARRWPTSPWRTRSRPRARPPLTVSSAQRACVWGAAPTMQCVCV